MTNVTDTPTYECDICGRAFGNKGLLAIHKKKGNCLDPVEETPVIEAETVDEEEPIEEVPPQAGYKDRGAWYNQRIATQIWLGRDSDIFLAIQNEADRDNVPRTEVILRALEEYFA